MRLPPRWLRLPIATLLLVALLVGSVALLAVCVIPVGLAAIWWEPARRVRRVLTFAPVVPAVELAALAAAFGLWLGRAGEATTYRVLGRFLRVLVRTASRLLGLRLDAGVRHWPADGLARSSRPLLVLCRHAGPGDSLIVLEALINRYGLRPRLVMKDTVRLDPVVDTYFGRLPAAFVSSRPDEAAAPATEAIGELAAGLGAGDALVMFPEGGNYTPRRHRRAVRHLVRKGHRTEAVRAGRLRRVMPPRPGGVLTVLDSAAVDVLFIGHTGFGEIHSTGAVWSALGRPQPFRLRPWLVAARDVPVDREQRVDWLFNQWARVDEWVDAQSNGGA